MENLKNRNVDRLGIKRLNFFSIRNWFGVKKKKKREWMVSGNGRIGKLIRGRFVEMKNYSAILDFFFYIFTNSLDIVVFIFVWNYVPFLIRGEHYVKIFRRELERSIIGSDRRISISDRSTNWMSKDELHRRKFFSATIGMFYPRIWPIDQLNIPNFNCWMLNIPFKQPKIGLPFDN